MAGLTWQVDAIVDLDDIATFIARQSPDFAPVFVESVVRAAERLASFPEMGRIVPELGDTELRELIFQNYRIVHWMRAGEVVVLGVLHSALDFGALPSREAGILRRRLSAFSLRKRTTPATLPALSISIGVLR